MKTIRIYGASDDLLEIDGELPGCGEYDCWEKTAQVEVVSPNGRLLVVGGYGAAGQTVGGWWFSPLFDDEDARAPEWECRVDLQARPYSVVLEIDAPEDAVVEVRA
jgi:hypothetical protein